MMLRSRTSSSSASSGATGDAAQETPDLRGIAVEHGGDRDPVLGEDRRARDRAAQPPGSDEGDVVLPLRSQDPADLAEQRVDVVADPALAEAPEAGQIPTDLGGVDVRVLRDLLRRDPVLAHLLRLREHLQVAAEPRRHAHCQSLRHRVSRFCRRSGFFVTTCHILPASFPRRCGEPSCPMRSRSPSTVTK